MSKTSNAIRILEHRIRPDPKFWEAVEEERLNSAIAQMIYEARTHAGLTQAQLAKLVGTKQPVIARLEDANYRGHSLTMLRRVARALNLHLTVRLTPLKRKRA